MIVKYKIVETGAIIEVSQPDKGESYCATIKEGNTCCNRPKPTQCLGCIFSACVIMSLRNGSIIKYDYEPISLEISPEMLFPVIL